MKPEQDRMIADAKRAARRLARTRPESYQACLDIVAASVGRSNWSAFLVDPAPMPAPPSDTTEGIVLGLDDSGRWIRSSRSSVVLCEGATATSKLLTTVLPTLMGSPTSSQIVNDPKLELIECARLIGYTEDRRILIVNPLAPPNHPGAVAFNPLHPAYRGDGITDILRHAEAVSSTIVLTSQGSLKYFEDKARELLAAIITHLSLHPEDIPENHDQPVGSRIASLPAVIDWTSRVFYEDGRFSSHKIDSLAEPIAMNKNIQGAEGVRRNFKIMRDMALNERTAILGTMNKSLLFLKNHTVRSWMDPINPDDGATIIQALDDPEKPTSIFLQSDLGTAITTAPARSLLIDAIGRWRTHKGPSSRSLQFILDEATSHLPPSPWLDDVLVSGAPSGTSVLLVMQGFEERSFRKVTSGIAVDDIRFDAIVKLETNAPKKDHEWHRYLTATSLDNEDALTKIKIGPSSWESSHVLINSDGARIVRNDCINPHRERSS